MVTHLWGRITNPAGKSVTLEMETMESYQLTAYTSVEVAQRILKGDVKPGYQTPAGALGSDFIDQFDRYKLIEVNG